MQSCAILVAFAFTICIFLVKGDDLENEDKEYLRKFGYLHMKKDSPFVASMTSKDVLISALKDFQRMAGLDQTGVMDADTKEVMKMPRCGVSDLQSTGQLKRKRYALYGTKWNYLALTYRVVNYPKVLPKDKVEKTIAGALEYWQNVSGLIFEVTNEKSVIEVSFHVKAHGDDDPFDGNGGTLAHAYFPTANPLGGDVHFDADETWTLNEHRGTNLLQVAIHELGHSLGLSHSDVKGSIMAPFYRDYDPNLKLHDDDIKGIQRLYGFPQLKPDSVTTLSHTTPAIKGICQLKGPGAIFSLFDLLFVFEVGKLFVMNGLFDNKAKQYNPSFIFPELPLGVDTAFAFESLSSRNTKYDFVYFFRGSKIWKYLFQEKPFGFTLVKNYPKLIETELPGVPNKLHAAFEWNLNGKMYFFQGNDYYRFSESQARVPSTYPRPITNWNLGIDHVDTAFNYPSKSFSELYFLRLGQVYKYDRNREGVALGYPKSMQWLFGCRSNDPVQNMVLENLPGSSSSLAANVVMLSSALIFKLLFV